MKCNCRRSVLSILLGSDTEFAEVVLGAISLFVGVWMMTPNAIAAFTSDSIQHYLPQSLGFVLLAAGCSKWASVCRGLVAWRKIACLMALVAWLFVGLSLWHSSNIHKILFPLSIMMFSFNLLVWVHLTVGYDIVRRQLHQ